MIIDVLINSCARPDILEVSLFTFLERIKSDKHTFRYVLVEDKMDDEVRQANGAEWIEKHAELFDEVVFLEKHAGPGCWWAPTIKLCKSDYHFHLEDDNEFIVDINIDPIIDVLQNNDDIVEIILSRGEIRKDLNPRQQTINGVVLTEFDLLSVATGLFNTKNVKFIIDILGWDNRLHEFGTLTPTSKKLGLRKFILGPVDSKHYIHVGEEKGYRKGGYKNE